MVTTTAITTPNFPLEVNIFSGSVPGACANSVADNITIKTTNKHPRDENI